MPNESKPTPYDHWNHLPVDHLVLASEDFVVFLHADLAIDWETSDTYKDWPPEGWGVIENRAATLEDSLLPEVQQRSKKALHRLIAEGIARGLEGEPDQAIAILDEADRFAKDRNREVGRLTRVRAGALSASLIVGAALVTTVVAILAGVEAPATSATIVKYVQCAGAGSLGALLSMLRTIGTFPDAYADSRLQVAEAWARIFVGAIGAVFAALAVNSGVINLGAAFDTLPALLVLSLVAGASERLVPDLIQKIDGSGSSGLRVEVPTSKSVPKARTKSSTAKPVGKGGADSGVTGGESPVVKEGHERRGNAT